MMRLAADKRLPRVKIRYRQRCHEGSNAHQGQRPRVIRPMRHRRPVAAAAFIATAAAILTACSSSVLAGPSSSAPPGPPAAVAGAQAATSPAAAVIANAMHLPAIVVITAATDPNHLLGRQGGYTSDVDAGPTYSPGSTGSIGIEVYPDAAGAARRVTYLESFTGTMLGDGYDYQAGTAILRLDSHYTPAQAHTLEAAFRKAAQ